MSLISLAASLLACAWGCNVVGAAAYVIGPPSVEPEYVPEKTPMLVLAESPSGPASPSMVGEQIERYVMAELAKHDIAPMAENEKVYELRLSDPQKFSTMSIAALGRLASAAQVLYITAHSDAGDLAAGAGMYRGHGSAHVRIVDVATGETLWPSNESAGYPVSYEARMRAPQSGTDAATVQRQIYAGLADRIVKLFYKYKPDEFEE